MKNPHHTILSASLQGFLRNKSTPFGGETYPKGVILKKKSKRKLFLSPDE